MKKVLIIDDEVDLCYMIKQFLTKKDYVVYMAHTLFDGLDKLNRIRPDCLLLDNNLPDGMGWDQVDKIQQQYPGMNITLISAYQLAKDFKYEQSSTLNFLEKPISLHDIEKYI